MKRSGRAALTVVLLVVLGLGGRALAESGPLQLLRGITSDSSVATLQGGAYQLQATIGEPIVAHAGSGSTTVDAGTWYTAPSPTPTSGGGGTGSARVYLPLVTR